MKKMESEIKNSEFLEQLSGNTKERCLSLVYYYLGAESETGKNVEDAVKASGIPFPDASKFSGGRYGKQAMRRYEIEILVPFLDEKERGIEEHQMKEAVRFREYIEQFAEPDVLFTRLRAGYSEHFLSTGGKKASDWLQDEYHRVSVNNSRFGADNQIEAWVTKKLQLEHSWSKSDEQIAEIIKELFPAEPQVIKDRLMVLFHLREEAPGLKYSVNTLWKLPKSLKVKGRDWLNAQWQSNSLRKHRIDEVFKKPKKSRRKSDEHVYPQGNPSE